MILVTDVKCLDIKNGHELVKFSIELLFFFPARNTYLLFIISCNCFNIVRGKQKMIWNVEALKQQKFSTVFEVVFTLVE